MAIQMAQPQSFLPSARGVAKIGQGRPIAPPQWQLSVISSGGVMLGSSLCHVGIMGDVVSTWSHIQWVPYDFKWSCSGAREHMYSGANYNG